MKQSMDLNKETASRLWVKQFGKKQKAVDFSGRTIARAAYNDRNSEYGWNVDHILPESRGGKTADHNLVCCHIKTNDEKADKFPCFKANGKVFEIQQRQNHYEIFAKSGTTHQPQSSDVNFMDVAQGLRCWKQCKADGKDVFVGYVKIRVELPNRPNQPNLLLLEQYQNFLSELFDTNMIFIVESEPVPRLTWNHFFDYTIIVNDIPTTEDSQNFLDTCVTLNTYNAYFKETTDFESIKVVCGMKRYANHVVAATRYKQDMIDKYVTYPCELAIDELVKINTDAEDDLENVSSQNHLYPYNIVYTQLKKNLEKRI